jgi:formiminotetrahydrofolate cyclodeaminase
MSEFSLANCTVRDFAARLAGPAPTPGGGSAAALAGALGAALGRMVAAYTLGKPKFAAVEAPVRELALQLERAQTALLELMDEDASAYGVLSEALKLPRDDPDRAARLERSALLAASVPLETATIAVRIAEAGQTLAKIGNAMLRSDAEACGHLARSGALAAIANVRANLALMSPSDRGQFEESLAALSVRLSDRPS